VSVCLERLSVRVLRTGDRFGLWTNTGSGLSGWTITISYPTQIFLVTESAGTWSRNGNTLTGISTGALATGDVVHTVVEGPAPSGGTIQQPSVTVDGFACTP